MAGLTMNEPPFINKVRMVPISQIWTVASYIWRRKFKGRKKYPLLLMLEPLFRCNLACLDAARSNTRIIF